MDDPTDVDLSEFEDDPERAIMRTIAELERERAEHPERFETVTDLATGRIKVWRRS